MVYAIWNTRMNIAFTLCFLYLGPNTPPANTHDYREPVLIPGVNPLTPRDKSMDLYLLKQKKKETVHKYIILFIIWTILSGAIVYLLTELILYSSYLTHLL